MEKLKRTSRMKYETNNEPEAIVEVKQKDDKVATLYQNALDLMDKGSIADYELAGLIFDTIKGYENSNELYKQCQQKINDTKLEHAKELMAQNTMISLQKAKDLLTEMQADDVLIQECNRSLVSVSYQEAVDLMEKEDYEYALTIFNSIKGYEDTDQKIKECEDRIKEIQEELEKANRPKFGKYIIALLVLIILGVGGYFGYQYFITPTLSLKTVKVELGEEVKLEPALFMDDSSKNIGKEDLIIDSDLMTNTDLYVYDNENKTVVSKDKEYLVVGKYDVMISTKDGSLEGTTTLEVVDTTAPKITCSENEFNYEIGYGQGDYAQFFTIEDLSQAQLTIDTSAVDWENPGTYTMKAIATDEYGNKSEMEKSIVVTAPMGSAQEEPAPVYQNDYYYYYQPQQETIVQEEQPEIPNEEVPDVPETPEPEVTEGDE